MKDKQKINKSIEHMEHQMPIFIANKKDIAMKKDCLIIMRHNLCLILVENGGWTKVFIEMFF